MANDFLKNGGISIHALVKRATGLQRQEPLLQPNFNPRPREEGDEYTMTENSVIKIISIHALVKRATLVTEYGEIDEDNFNPRPREEGDDIGSYL